MCTSSPAHTCGLVAIARCLKGKTGGPVELVASGRLSASGLDWPCPTSGWWRVQVGNTSAHELRTGMLQVSRVSMAPAKARGAAQSGVVYAQWEPAHICSVRNP